MYNNLSKIRNSFGFSQEQLAEKMEKDVSTISRWERGKTREPVLAPFVNVANRKYQYVRHMMDENIVDSVVNSDSVSGIFYGTNFMIMAMSKGTLANYPLLRSAYGFLASSYFRNEGKRLHQDEMDNLSKALSLPGSSGIWKVPANSGIIISKALVINFEVVGYGLSYVEAHTMPVEEADNFKVATAEFIFG